MPRTVRSDPTKTGSIRKKFERKLRKGYREFAKKINTLVDEEDSFGLKHKRPTVDQFVSNATGWALLINILDQPVIDGLNSLKDQLDPNHVIAYEDDPHITLITEIDREPKHLAGSVPDWWLLKLGRLNLFQNERSDVLYVEVKSKLLESLYNGLTTLFPGKRPIRPYTPHITLAHLHPGTGSQYLTLFNTLYSLELKDIEIVSSSPSKKQQKTITANMEWAFLDDPEKLAEFEQWLKDNTDLAIVPEDDRFWEQLVEEGYRKGAGRAFNDTKKPRGRSGVGAQHQFVSSTLNAPESVRKVKLLASSTLNLIKGANDEMRNRIKFDLVTGLTQGDNPRAIARRMKDRIDVSRRRAEVIARTEIIRAHAEGQLDALEQLGVEEIGVAVEWSDADDTRVCPQCSAMNGVVLRVKDAHGLIPLHPECRCAFAPANVGESTKGQKRTKKAISAALDEAIEVTIPKRSKRTLRQQRALSKWRGAKLKPKKAPEPV